MNKIEGTPKSLKQLLQNTKYSIHYYQREYMWQRKQIEELLEDLKSEFLESYTRGDGREKVAGYGVYFMGSVVLSGRENAIIDGQQRLSSLTLLLIYLRNRLKAIGKEHYTINAMIYSESFGSESFNIDVESRRDCMFALFREQDFDTADCGESERNLYDRYKDIEELLPIDTGNEIDNENILHFCDWLTERVFFIEIAASTEQDAHKVFVSMNDRGLSLTSTEMLKGYVLSQIKDDRRREQLNTKWKETVLALRRGGEKEDEVFIKAWLRAQYAETIRDTKAGAVNKDFDIIGGPFHKWVQEERVRLGLVSSEAFEQFIESFAFFAKHYLTLREAELTLNEELPYVFFNAHVDFTLQPQLLLAALTEKDSDAEAKYKMNLTARFIDLYIIARSSNLRSLNYSTIKNYVFGVTRAIRRKSLPELKSILKIQFNELEYNADTAIETCSLNNLSKKYIKHMLARVTGYVQEQCGLCSDYARFMDRQSKNPYEIEHIITNHPEWFTNDYDDNDTFHRYRNKLGALLLLRKSINASLQDMLYEKKLPKYTSTEGNLYAATLGHSAYVNNPRFQRFIKEKNLPFRPHDEFHQEDIEERTKLFAALCKLIWNTEMFKQ